MPSGSMNPARARPKFYPNLSVEPDPSPRHVDRLKSIVNHWITL